MSFLNFARGANGRRSRFATRCFCSGGGAVPSFRIYYNDVYKVTLPPKHRFPMEKYRQVRKQLQELVARLPADEQARVACDFVVSPLATVEELETTHSPEYIQRFLTGDQTEEEQRNVGFPWSREGVDRALSSVGGTVAAACHLCQQVREQRELETQNMSPLPPPAPWAAHVAGGTHHAFYDRGEGFSVFSDIAVAANVVLQRFPDVVQNVLIVDCDCHQGNGNCVLFQNDNRVFSFSIHCEANIFSKKEEGDLDIELPAGCTDGTYLMTLNHWLNRFRNAHLASGEKGNSHGGGGETSPFKVDLIFYQAGVDILEDDRLGRMNISHRGVQKRNDLVYQFANNLKVPLVITMGGGYPKRDSWESIVGAHANVYYEAFQFLSQLSSVTLYQDDILQEAEKVSTTNT